jgi:hypothetical protein
MMMTRFYSVHVAGRRTRQALHKCEKCSEGVKGILIQKLKLGAKRGFVFQCAQKAIHGILFVSDVFMDNLENLGFVLKDELYL